MARTDGKGAFLMRKHIVKMNQNHTCGSSCLTKQVHRFFSYKQAYYFVIPKELVMYMMKNVKIREMHPDDEDVCMEENHRFNMPKGFH